MGAWYCNGSGRIPSLIDLYRDSSSRTEQAGTAWGAFVKLDAVIAGGFHIVCCERQTPVAWAEQEAEGRVVDRGAVTDTEDDEALG